MDYRETPCSGILGNFIECEWSAEMDAAGALVHPDGCADLVFDETGQSYVFGITGKSRSLDTCLGQALRGFRLKPGSVPFLFDVPASELSNQVTSLAGLSSPIARSITAIARQAASQDELVAAAAKFLSEACATKTRERGSLRFALSQIDH